jgi:hypothetical protein
MTPGITRHAPESCGCVYITQVTDDLGWTGINTYPVETCETHAQAEQAVRDAADLAARRNRSQPISEAELARRITADTFGPASLERAAQRV